MGKFIDLTGQTFGRLTVLYCAGRDRWGTSTWVCQCSCGTITEPIVGKDLRRGRWEVSHWFLRKEPFYLDITAAQFGKTPIPYHKAIGCGFLHELPIGRRGRDNAQGGPLLKIVVYLKNAKGDSNGQGRND
jgi:hypothetical protein